MAVAAYGSVLNLLRAIDNIQLPSSRRFFPDYKQIDALREKLCFLQEFLELHSSTISEDIERVVRKIPEVASDAESFIDKYMVDQLYRELYPQSDAVGCNIDSVRDEIHRVIQEITPINYALTTIKDTQHDQEQHRSVLNNKPLPNDHSLKSSGLNNKMVGFEDQLNQVLEKLTSNQPNLMILPIVGMGGIGKTTLARSIFDHPYNLHHFSVRIWLTISQDYSVKKVLQELLNDGVLGDKKDRELGNKSEAELITQLYQKLFGQRYLIVLDDVWSAEAWDDLKRGFPNNGKGSRVMVTTRLSDIANSSDSRNNNTYSMKFLDDDKSWDLFSEKAFEKGGRSRELEEIGRVISKRCKGLPLLLVVIGGLLANSNMTVEYWQTVKENINSFASSANDEYCLRIFSLSYNNLPIHLKLCFLYMRHFEEDSQVKVSQLIKKWVSQGFVRPMRGKTLEEAARRYLEDLIGRNMLLIRGRCKKGKIRFCGIHDILRDLCIKESNKEQLWDVSRILLVAHFSQCYLCKKPRTEEMLLLSEIFAGSEFFKTSMCIYCMSRLPEFGRSRFAMAVKTNSQNIEVMTRYRQLSIGRHAESLVVLHAIRLLWNLECLQIGYGSLPFGSVMPQEIWEMPQLRHMVSDSEFRLPDPVSTSKNDVTVLENMQTIKIIRNFKCTEEIVRRIPNLRKLGLWYSGFATDEEEELSFFNLQNLAHLQKLESFAIYCSRSFFMDLKKDIAFPRSLKKLSLGGCQIAWDDLTIISTSSLPNLEVLKLWRRSVLGEEWNFIEGELSLLFLRLKYLKLQGLDLVHWRAVHDFPALETLVIRDVWDLEAIPREIGELPSLNSIYLKGCDKNVIDSARVIVEEQLSNGNEQLVVHVKDSESTYQIGGANRVG